MKETFYFSHDYHARHDIKMETLSMEKIGVYWCLIEMLYEENGYIKLNLCERIAVALRVQCDTIKSVLEDFGLFENDGTQFWSNSVLRRLKIRENRSIQAKKSADKRWKKENGSVDTNECERIAIKESKVNKRKENIYRESGEQAPTPSKTIKFIPPTIEQVNEYCLERSNGIDAEQFVNFYTAKNWMIGKNKMKEWKACVITWEKRNKDNPKQNFKSSEEQAIQELKQKYAKYN